jgi:hypothetical protein
MQLRLRVKILMRLRLLRLRLLPYCNARQNIQNELKFKYMLKLLYLVYVILYDLQYIAENMNGMGYKLFYFEPFFNS